MIILSALHGSNIVPAVSIDVNEVDGLEITATRSNTLGPDGKIGCRTLTLQGGEIDIEASRHEVVLVVRADRSITIGPTAKLALIAQSGIHCSGATTFSAGSLEIVNCKR